MAERNEGILGIGEGQFYNTEKKGKLRIKR